MVICKDRDFFWISGLSGLSGFSGLSGLAMISMFSAPFSKKNTKFVPI